MQKVLSRWQDGLTLIVGIWLFVSPAVLGFGESEPVTWAALGIGAVLMIVALLSLATAKLWEEWLMVAAGLVLVCAPWIFGFAAIQAAVISFVICGIAAIALSVWRIYRDSHGQEASHA